MLFDMESRKCFYVPKVEKDERSEEELEEKIPEGDRQNGGVPSDERNRNRWITDILETKSCLE